jgi:uncharacterized membrane protein YozB (DUF420 family)
LVLILFLSNLIALHAGTPVVVSQTTLTAMFVVLGIILIGIGFGVMSKNRESLLLHRWSMSVAVALATGAILLVMLPAALNFYIDPDLQFFSPLSLFTFVHVVIGVPAITLGLIYAFGDLPQKLRRWMRWTAIFWVGSLALGTIVFLEMLGLLPF